MVWLWVIRYTCIKSPHCSVYIGNFTHNEMLRSQWFIFQLQIWSFITVITGNFRFVQVQSATFHIQISELWCYFALAVLAHKLYTHTGMRLYVSFSFFNSRPCLLYFSNEIPLSFRSKCTKEQREKHLNYITGKNRKLAIGKSRNTVQ